MASRLSKYLVDNLTFISVASVASVAIWRIWRQENKSKYAQKKLDSAVKSGLGEPLTLHPEIDPTLCVGCAACTSSCPEGDILQLINNKAVLVGPSKCVGHGECERACPLSAIKLVFGTKTRGVEIPRLTGNYETNVPGLYIAGELGGMGLIRNAIRQGTQAARHAIKSLPSVKTDVDLLVVGAGPAGLAACLAATEAKRSYVCVEQGTFGGTIANFPRQKVVMSHPFELPIFGVAKFKSNKVSKEELLDYWGDVRKQSRLNIKEQTRFTGVKVENGIFKVDTSVGSLTAKKVILALGVRGTPRRLGVPGEDSTKVAYNLLEPQEFAGKKVIVVGGGNAGVEAAQMLGKSSLKCTVHLLVRGPAFDRCNEDNKMRIEAMAKKGQVQIWYNSSIQEIHKDTVKLKKDDQMLELPNDQVFVFAGADIPTKFLMSLGVAFDKKFGEGLAKAR
jgi:thioredoxin reductase/NAD-dependent dihydropyrimidine dehydrogenase PreA subunit